MYPGTVTKFFKKLLSLIVLLLALLVFILIPICGEKQRRLYEMYFYYSPCP